ncbi:MAG TPA: hydrophobe/amphiphile efflux-3 (HAE3) family transporter [Methanoregula sp.]|nr:hydrophobe/amphiphile efflux-3 (HAE3) family transporter [Methanoregula sp.]
MIDELFTHIARAINRYPKQIAVLVAVVFCISLYGMTTITMETGASTYLNSDSAKGVLYNKYIDTFQSDTLILIVETNDPLNPDVLSYMDRLETDIRQQQNIRSVSSIVDILKNANGNRLPQSRTQIDATVESIPPEVRSTAVPSNILSLVQIQLSQGLSDTAKTSALNDVKSIVASSNPPAGTTVTVTGSPAFSKEMSNGLQQNMGILIGAAMILMIVVMGILFAYVRYRFMPVFLVGGGLVTSLGMMGLAGIRLNMAVIGAFPVLIGLGIDYAIQFHARFDEESRKGTLEQAVTMTVTRTGPAVLYAMLATCMGFLAMFISPVPMIRSFGLVSIIGVMSSYAVALVGMPTLALLLRYRPKPQKPTECYAVGTDACAYLDDAGMPRGPAAAPAKKGWSYGQFLTETSVKIAKNPVPILLIAALIAVIGFQLDAVIAIETSENAFVPSDMPAKIEMDKVARVIGSTDSATIYLQGQSVTDLDALVWEKKFQDYELSHHSELTRATSLVTYVMAYNNGSMPETQSQLNGILAKLPATVRDPYVSGSMNGVINFGTLKLESEQQESLKEQMTKDIAFLEPPIGFLVQPTGSFDLFTTLMHDLTSSKETMTFLGFLLIFLYLVLVYRHLHAVSPLVPIIAIIGWNSVAMFALGIAYTPLTATLGSMTIGVAAEYTILVMERYAEEEERLHDPLAAIQESVQKIGTAITVSGLATFFGFSALCLATFPIISNFGVTTLIAVGFSLMGAIFIMPAILSLIGRMTSHQHPAAIAAVVEPEELE